MSEGPNNPEVVWKGFEEYLAKRFSPLGLIPGAQGREPPAPRTASQYHNIGETTLRGGDLPGHSPYVQRGESLGHNKARKSGDVLGGQLYEIRALRAIITFFDSDNGANVHRLSDYELSTADWTIRPNAEVSSLLFVGKLVLDRHLKETFGDSGKLTDFYDWAVRQRFLIACKHPLEEGQELIRYALTKLGRGHITAMLGAKEFRDLTRRFDESNEPVTILHPRTARPVTRESPKQYAPARLLRQHSGRPADSLTDPKKTEVPGDYTPQVHARRATDPAPAGEVVHLGLQEVIDDDKRAKRMRAAQLARKQVEDKKGLLGKLKGVLGS